MRFKREKFAPSLIDLVKFEKDCLWSLYRGSRFQPVPPIPGIGGWGPGWTDSELQAMRDNRAKAEEITSRISRLLILEQEGNIVMDESVIVDETSK